MIARTLICVSILGGLLLDLPGAEAWITAPAPEMVRAPLIDRSNWTDKKVAAVLQKAKTDPEVLWKLRAAPIDKVFDPLMRLWLDGGGELWKEILVLGPASEDPADISGFSRKERQSIIARRILSTHDQLDEYVYPKVQRLCDTFRRRVEMKDVAGKNEFVACRKESIELLKLAVICRAVDGTEIVNAFLRCPDELDASQENYVETSVPHWAVWAITERAGNKGRGQIPSDLEEARKWWETHSFFISEFLEPYLIDRWPNERVAAVLEAAKTNAFALRELREVPLEKTFDGLMRLWKEGKASRQRQADAGISDITALRWMSSEEESIRDHLRVREVAREARHALEEHSNWEAFAVSRLHRLKQLFATGQLRGESAGKKEIVAARGEAVELLDFASGQRGNGGYRIIASFLSAPDAIRPSWRGYVKTPPAAWAQAALATRVRQRWDESIPEDIVGARAWWAQNQARFVEGAVQRKPAIPGAKGYNGTARIFGNGRAGTPGALTEYIDGLESVFRDYFAEETVPDHFSFMARLEQGKLPQYVFPSHPKNVEALHQLKAPEVTGGSVTVVLKAKIAGGWRYAKEPKEDDIRVLGCGTPDTPDDMQKIVAFLMED